MKAVLDRKKSSAAIVAASGRWAATTAEGLAELLRPELAEGETLPDLEPLQRLLGRALARRWRRLEAADQARERAAQRRRRQRAEQLAARATLYRRVVGLRRLLRGVFGGAACRRLLGIAGETSRDDVVLLRQARHIVACLAGDSRGLPPASFELTAADLARWRAPVESAAETLRSAADLAAGAGRELEAAGAELSRAIADFDSAFLRVASLLGGAYTGAGREQRAAAVRPSRRRLGRLLEADDRASAPEAAPASAALGSSTVRRGRVRSAPSGPAPPRQERARSAHPSLGPSWAATGRAATGRAATVDTLRPAPAVPVPARAPPPASRSAKAGLAPAAHSDSPKDARGRQGIPFPGDVPVSRRPPPGIEMPG